MPNKQYADEWRRIAEKHLEAAKILFKANHYNDIIGIELQQSLEKLLKSVLAYYNKQIPRTHDLVELYEYVRDYIMIDEENIDCLDIATGYFSENRYPSPQYGLPADKEIEKIIEFTELVMQMVHDIIQ